MRTVRSFGIVGSLSVVGLGVDAAGAGLLGLADPSTDPLGVDAAGSAEQPQTASAVTTTLAITRRLGLMAS